MDEHSDLLCRVLASQNLVTEILARFVVAGGGEVDQTIDFARAASTARIERVFGNAGKSHGSDDMHEFMHRILHYSEEIWDDVASHIRPQP